MKSKTIAVSVWMSAVMMMVSGLAFSDDDSGGSLGHWGKRGVAPVTNPQYREECGGCHFAYQPGLLPVRSWKKLMAGLDDHFGENAELPAEDRQAMTDYLVNNAADKANYHRSQKIMKYMRKNETPLRISETRYFVREHDELSNRMVKNNPKVGSFSNCEACHTRADKGSFREREISIPGFGRWEDD